MPRSLRSVLPERKRLRGVLPTALSVPSARRSYSQDQKIDEVSRDVRRHVVLEH
jgi:hypothetical protein